MNKFQLLCDKFYLIRYFIHTRWLLKFTDSQALIRRQNKQLIYYLKNILPQAPYFQSYHHRMESVQLPIVMAEPYQALVLAQLPMMDKSFMMAQFDELNTRNITFEQASAVARQAEQSRDFSPVIDDITVGMSSGTSGKHGIFLVSKEERLRWAGTILAKVLPDHLLWKIVKLWQPPVKIAFFLRANSNLYTTLNSSRINFGFYDLLQGIELAIPNLNHNPPDVLVAPASVLLALVKAKQTGALEIQPTHIISVAEVLETTDAVLIEQAFGIKPHQIYQATEGFLGYTCEEGNFHLNETHLIIEKEWLDEAHQYFTPVVTDFSRTTQLIVRYRLNDVLRVAPTPCPCGRAETTIASVEGRADEILWLSSLSDSVLIPVYPDLIRRAMMLVLPQLTEYQIIQKQLSWQIDFLVDNDSERPKALEDIIAQLAKLCEQLNLQLPLLQFGVWQSPQAGVKRRRLICQERPV